MSTSWTSGVERVRKLSEIAHVIRSKNAGPFEITFDIIFSDRTTYERVKRTGLIGRNLFSRLYRVPEEHCDFLCFDGACAFKCTIPRPIAAGDIGDSDVYGAQQHAPLLTVEVPLDE